MELEIIGIPQSNYLRAVRIACEEKGLAYRLTPEMPRSPVMAAIHPLGKVPGMRHGDFILYESMAIAAYIDRSFPGPKIFPDTVQAAARVTQWVSLCNVSLFAMTGNYVRPYFFPSGPGGKPDRALVDTAIPDMQRALTILDKAVAETGFLAGETFSYADMNLLPVLAFMQDCPESRDTLEGLKSLAVYFKKHAARPSFVKTAPPPFSELRRAS